MFPVNNNYLIVWINIGITMYPVSNNPFTLEGTNCIYIKNRSWIISGKALKDIHNISSNGAPLYPKVVVFQSLTLDKHGQHFARS